jgi:ATP adenylyltransferase
MALVSATNLVTVTELVDGCLACDVQRGRVPLPGGVVKETAHWRVEHALGPLGVGVWIVKPRRHVTGVGDLSDDEAAELGPLLALTSRVAERLVECEQVYNELWSHAGEPRGHIHYVVAPVTTEQVERFGKGPYLHAGMFTAAEPLDLDAVEAMCDAARRAF